MSSSSPPVTTLEPCRIAPYVNVPSMRNSSSNTQSTSAYSASVFPHFDPALLSAAHQVGWYLLLYLLSSYGFLISLFSTDFYTVRGSFDSILKWSSLTSVSVGSGCFYGNAMQEFEYCRFEDESEKTCGCIGIDREGYLKVID